MTKCEMVYDATADCGTKCAVHGETSIVHVCGKAAQKVDLRAFRAEIRSLTPAQARELVNSIIGVYKEELRRVNSKAAMEFEVGDKVTFNGRKGEGFWTGSVTKINRTSVSVLATLNPLFEGLPRSTRKMEWRVHPSMLKKVA